MTSQEAKHREAKPKKKCFVICPIGADGSDERKRSDMALKHVFAKAVEPFGYTAIRADKLSEPGMITQQIIKHLMTADLAIADMTGYNANVFYELAVRHAVEKPVIHVIEAGQRIPFDVADLRTIEMKLDLDGAEKAVTAIQEQVQAIEAGRSGHTPVQLAAAVQKLGNDPTNDVLREIVNSVSTLRADVGKLVRAMQPSPLLTSGLGAIANLQPLNVWSPRPYSVEDLRTLADLGLSEPASGETTRREKANAIGEIRETQKKEQKDHPKG